jgi:putative endonuclease
LRRLQLRPDCASAECHFCLPPILGKSNPLLARVAGFSFAFASDPGHDGFVGWLEERRRIAWIDWMERAAAGLHRMARRSSRADRGPAHLETGIEGETAAFFHLRRKGYTVVAQRWASGLQRGDLDLVAWDGPLLCFIEVKTRTAHDIAAAEVAVDEKKRRTIRKLARHFVRHLPMKEAPPVRFDVLSVYLLPGKPREFVHFEGAFGWSEEREYEYR